MHRDQTQPAPSMAFLRWPDLCQVLRAAVAAPRGPLDVPALCRLLEPHNNVHELVVVAALRNFLYHVNAGGRRDQVFYLVAQDQVQQSCAAVADSGTLLAAHLRVTASTDPNHICEVDGRSNCASGAAFRHVLDTYYRCIAEYQSTCAP